MSNQYFVVEASGDGAVCKIVLESQLHDAVHGLLCTCDAGWEGCDTEWIREILKSLDDPIEWSRFYPTHQDHAWEREFEDGNVRAIRVTEPLPLSEDVEDAFRKRKAAEVELVETALAAAAAVHGQPVTCKNCGSAGITARDIAICEGCPACNDDICMLCGCTTLRACDGGCFWIVPMVCSTHDWAAENSRIRKRIASEVSRKV